MVKKVETKKAPVKSVAKNIKKAPTKSIVNTNIKKEGQKIKKDKNLESFGNKFAMPVFKLSAVAVLTAGAIGLTYEVTKNTIEQNVYEQKLSAYMDMGNRLGNWTPEGSKETANFALYGTKNEDFYVEDFSKLSDKTFDTGSVIEIMTYCNSSKGYSCNADSNDVSAFGFTTQGNPGGYGMMTMQILTDADGIIRAWDQLGFVTSFGAQTAKTLEAMEEMVGKDVTTVSFTDISDASTSVTNSGISSMLGDIASLYQSVAVDPKAIIEGELEKAANNTVSTTNKIDAKAEDFEAEDVITRADDDTVTYQVNLADGGYLFIVRWNSTWNSGTEVMIQVAEDGTNFKWDLLNKNYFLTTSIPELVNDNGRVISWMNAITDINNVSIDGPILDASTDDSKNDVGKNFAASIKSAWDMKGGN